MDIKVLGPGCPKCQQTEKVVKEVVVESGISARVESPSNFTSSVSGGVILESENDTPIS